ncbi:hypothetical protein LTR46_004621 [Exophiala xenobiotica]|nr:hypothetical protein LTR46_004621 [Exophiala xenobiotica]
MATTPEMPALASFTEKWHTEPYSSISPKRPELASSGKNVIVTGGATGIGQSIAVAFAQAGAKSVSIIGRRLDKLKEAVDIISKEASKDTEVLYEQADLSDRAQVDAAIKSITDKSGKIDILVSNHGFLPPLGMLVGYDAGKFMQGFELNVLTTFNALQAFVPVAGPEPVVINISTAIAHFRPMLGAGGYGVSKAAALKMMDYFAWENPQIHVVNVQPGWVPTDINGHDTNAPDAVELPGQFCVWLASPEAKFLNRKFVWANWDVEEMMKRADEIKNSKLLDWMLEGVPM